MSLGHRKKEWWAGRGRHRKEKHKNADFWSELRVPGPMKTHKCKCQRIRGERVCG